MPSGNRMSAPSKRYRLRLFLIAAVPLILAAGLIAVVVAVQSRTMAEREIAAFEAQMIEAKKAELKNYVTQARNGFYYIYGNARVDDAEARRRIASILSAMVYGKEGFFFVYDYDGTSIVSPRQTWLIGENWSGLTDSEGTPVVDELIRVARSGSGYHTYLWPKPSNGKEARMISYVTTFPIWRWAVGTGIFIDDVLATSAAARADLEARIRTTFLGIGAMTSSALLLVFGSGLWLNLRERTLAETKLKRLTQRVIDIQEEERGRVARELHDSISQILVGVRYSLELARRRYDSGDARASEALEKSVSGLAGAINEVRRISRDLRPGVLDDLGLGPALKALAEEFSTRTGIRCTLETVVFRNRLDQDAKIALYRVAQEALTNIERHSGATHVEMSLRGTTSGAIMRINDNGVGMDWPLPSSSGGGLGMRNMQERLEQLGGRLSVTSARDKGTTIEAQVPLTHMLPPDGARNGGET